MSAVIGNVVELVPARSRTEGPRVAAVIVTFHPNMSHLLELLEIYASQVWRCYLIDNSEALDFHEVGVKVPEGGLRLLRLGQNMGIATALNRGAQLAFEDGADFVVLSDQDSVPSSSMVDELMRSYRVVSGRCQRIGAIGPVYTNLHTHEKMPFQVKLPGRPFRKLVHPSAEVPEIEVMAMITSGTLIRKDAWFAVGGMRDDLFIDHVDHEWCLHARSLGYRLFGSYEAQLAQRLGEGAFDVWYFGWRKQPAYAPVRVYYNLRNGIALLFLPHIPKIWAIRQLWTMFGVVYTHVIFGRRRSASIRMALLALWHGFTGRRGRL